MMNQKSLLMIGIIAALAVGLGYVKLPGANIFNGYVDCLTQNPCSAGGDSSQGAITRLIGTDFQSCIVNSQCYATGRETSQYSYQTCPVPVSNGNSIEFSTAPCSVVNPPPGTNPPPAAHADFLSSIIATFTSVFSLIWQAIMSFFLPKGELIDTGQSIVQGQAFSHTFTLKNTLGYSIPDYDQNDGSVTYAYISKTIIDPSGNIMLPVTAASLEVVAEGDAKAANSEYNRSISYSLPPSAAPGKWSAIAILATHTHTYNINTNSWTSGTPVPIDNESAMFTVIARAGAPAPGGSDVLATITNSIASVIAGLICFLKSLIGLPC